MRRALVILVVIVCTTAGHHWIVEAGDLEPPGPPSPTMVTLQEIFDKHPPAGVPKTGLTTCWNEVGAPVDCAGTGQDGEYSFGISLTQRFTTNGDGTVKDNLTGLIWLQESVCFQLPWLGALDAVNSLASGSCGLTDGSRAGDWRVPNIRELRSLIDYTQFDPSLPSPHPFSLVQAPSQYWSSTTEMGDSFSAWIVDFNLGRVMNRNKANNFKVRPVRGGR